MAQVPTSLPRRDFLSGSASALAAAGLAGRHGPVFAQTAAAAAAPLAKPLPGYANWKNADALIVHSSTTIETKRSAFGTSVITPSRQLYVRNNLPLPADTIVADPDAWRLRVTGVRDPKSLSLRELKRLGLETVTMVLQCSGNGRAFFPSQPSGTPWTVGAAGCVTWSGVPVRDVVQALGGLADDLAYMTGTGGEVLPAGIDPKSVIVERSVPISAMQDALLAWEMNGEPTPLAHGGPLRLIVPGYAGVNNIKYIKQLAFTAKESDARIMSHGYRITPPGEKSDPSQPSVQEMRVKSWINSPLPEDRVCAGTVQIHGLAFGGMHAIQAVEISIDGGKTWRTARLVGPDMGKYAWRQFALQAKLPKGTHVLASRATDSQGHVQAQTRGENKSGYSNTSWADHALTITIV
ncbi:sulfite dehydrogenase [Comamonas sp. BIGb0152]|uniref:SorT family sulfite dehydrogenase catalytic subunit n=1 Tax=Comamonas sp. BIGb0152 TaxID=2940601 RepID=UPI0021682D01|nr:sulfite oxidase [Comamonas sp. BIGb0152]MCS4295961.1 sulfite dehydrogenase [Comamonas sp. BIGb0152]